jgi:hypothetical protein
MSSFVVNLVFSGFLMFAVEPDYNDSVVVIPDLTHEEAGLRSMVHVAEIRFSCTTLEDSADKTACLNDKLIPGIDSGPCGGLMCIPIKHYDISLRPKNVAAPDESLVMKRMIRPTGAHRHTNKDAEDTDWIIDMKSILRPLGREKSLELDALKEPIGSNFAGKVVGRVKLRGGLLFANVIEAEYGVWQFRTKNNYAVPYSQEAATEIRFRSDPADRFVLHIADFNGRAVKDLAFVFSAPIEIAISNEPTLDEFCRFEKRRKVFHFSHFYDLLDFGQGSDLPVPEITQRPQCTCRDRRQGTNGCGRTPIICMGAQVSSPDNIPMWIGE